ncbi:protein kinase [bacterium]|nr:protein kinase [bacterium]
MNNTANTTLEVGTVLNEKWVILEFIARGGMGEVYRAHQINLKRDVAIKLISREWLESCNDNDLERETGLGRFRREVQAMAQLRHPNVVQIFDYGSVLVKQEDLQEIAIEFIAMEYVPGGILRDTMSEEGFYPEADLTKKWLEKYFVPTIKGVQALHEQEIIHRDLKPENVLMDGDTPKIADFGLVRSCRLKPVTQSMDVKGTPAYMSPEHFFDFKRTDGRADIYALGKILCEAVTGKVPKGTLPFKCAGLDKPETPFFKNLDKIIRSATAENRDERLDSLEEFESALVEAIGPTQKKVSKFHHLRSNKSVFVFPKRGFIWIGTLLLITAGFIVPFWQWIGGFWRLGQDSKHSPVFIHEEVKPEHLDSFQRQLPQQSPLPQSIQSKDEMTLQFVPGGELTLPEAFRKEAEKNVQVKPFYMDETQVTNYQYVEFLNHEISRIQVDKNVVKGDGEIWLMLGEVQEGYEPIVFNDGQFHITHSGHASCAVLRVTAHGATAYAHYYGKRLPTDVEWLYVVQQGAKPSEEPKEKGVEATQRLFPIPTPVILFEANAFGIRGLNNSIGEWGFRNLETPTQEQLWETQYLLMGGKHAGEKGNMKTISPPMPREPWEAFGNVGFRSVLPIEDTENKRE